MDGYGFAERSRMVEAIGLVNAANADITLDEKFLRAFQTIAEQNPSDPLAVIEEYTQLCYSRFVLALAIPVSYEPFTPNLTCLLSSIFAFTQDI